jgi:hypothetical protein
MNIHDWNNKKFSENADKKVSNYVKKLDARWKKIDKKIFDSISRISGLKWKIKEIECYVVSIPICPFSVPLTIHIHNDLNWQIEILIHELIHNILVQNMERVIFKNYNKYGKLPFNTKIHILVHAIEREVLIGLFGENKASKHIKSYDKYPDYKKAWDIVGKESSKKIIKDWIK